MAPGRRGFNLHDLLFPRAHAGAAVAGLCAAATTGALATGGAAVVTVAALAAAVLVAGTLTPTQAFGPIVKRAVGDDGSVVEIRGQHGESRAVMTARDASGNEVVFELVRVGDGYALWDAVRLDGTGAVLPLTPLEAMGLTNELFGPVGGGFTEQRNDGMTVITPATEQLPLIFVTPEVRQNGFILSTPANPQRPLDLITTAPDVGWAELWMNEANDPWRREPTSLQDKLALEAAKTGAGERIISNLSDPRFEGMEKWEYRVKSAAGRDTVVHYVRDPVSGILMDFKFKKSSTD
jgi:hypothetical protein